MAGRQFMNVALPATATATAIAVASYWWYKKTSADNPDDRKPPAFPVTASSAAKRAPYVPLPEPDVPPSHLPKPAESSPCDSPPLITDVDATKVAEVPFLADDYQQESGDYGLEYHHSEFKNDVSDSTSSSYEKQLRDLDSVAAKIWVAVSESRALSIIPEVVDAGTQLISTVIESGPLAVPPEIEGKTSQKSEETDQTIFSAIPEIDESKVPTATTKIIDKILTSTVVIEDKLLKTTTLEKDSVKLPVTPEIVDELFKTTTSEKDSEKLPATPEIVDELLKTTTSEKDSVKLAVTTEIVDELLKTTTLEKVGVKLAVTPGIVDELLKTTTLEKVGAKLLVTPQTVDELLSITPEIDTKTNTREIKPDRDELMADRGVTDVKIEEEPAATLTPLSSQSTLVEEEKAESKVERDDESPADQRMPLLEDDEEEEQDEEPQEDEDEEEQQESGAYAIADRFQDMHLTSAPAEDVLNLQLGDMGYNMGYYDGGLAPILSPAEASHKPTFAHVVTAQIPSAFDSANHSPSEEMLESPCVSTYSDIHSEESSDSGKGGSDIHGPTLNSSPAAQDANVVFEFEIPQDLCGLLIGQHGSTIKHIKSSSQANVYLKRHQFNSRLKLCIVSGSQNDVEKALAMIRNKFPLAKYPVVTLTQVNANQPVFNNYPLPDTMQLYLPEGIMCDVVLSSLVSAGHFFVQQPTHPTYPGLSQLYHKMMRCYSKSDSPAIPTSVQPLSICAAPVMGGWYRAKLENILSNSECRIKYLDYGGYSSVPISSLRQIRGDFLWTPFQASECYLANVKPLNDEVGWTQEARETFERLAQGQFLQAQVVDYAEDGNPFVHLHRIQGIMTMFINRELVDCGVAAWYEHEV